jgi:deoxycytidylate deaminase
MEQIRRLFVVDELTDGKLFKELSELSKAGAFIPIELPASNLNHKLNQLFKLKKGEFSPDGTDSLVILIRGNQVPLANHWLSHREQAIQVAMGKYLFFHVSGGYNPNGDLCLSSFRLKTVINDANPKNIALLISNHFNLSPLVSDWDTYFMSLAYMASMLSTDDCTAIGAVIIQNDNNRIISTGHNTTARNDDFCGCAVCQAVNNAFRHRSSASRYADWRLYTQAIPRNECCLRLLERNIKSNSQPIKEIIVDRQWDKQRPFSDEQFQLAKAAYLEAGITLRQWDGELLKIHGRKRYQPFRTA